MPISEKVKVIPCSGIGKVFGLLAREAALLTASRLCSDKAENICLAYIMTDDCEAAAAIVGQPCITVDGCPKMCSAKSVTAMGGNVKESFKVLDVLKEHKGVQTGTGTELTAEGWVIVDEIAAKLSACVQEIHGEGR